MRNPTYFLEVEEYDYFKSKPVSMFNSLINKEKRFYTFSIADKSISRFRGKSFIKLIIRGLLAYHFPKYYYKLPWSWTEKLLEEGFDPYEQWGRKML